MNLALSALAGFVAGLLAVEAKERWRRRRSAPHVELTGVHFGTDPRSAHVKRGPTFMDPLEIISEHQAGTLEPRQGIVSLARSVLKLRSEIGFLRNDLKR